VLSDPDDEALSLFSEGEHFSPVVSFYLADLAQFFQRDAAGPFLENSKI
jgi:hypothetical protein